MKEGSKEGRKEGRKEGKREGREEGRKEALTRICTNSQPVFISFISNFKQVVLGVSCLSVEIFEIHPKLASSLCQTVNLIQSKPKFCAQIPETLFVVVPNAIKVN